MNSSLLCCIGPRVTVSLSMWLHHLNIFMTVYSACRVLNRRHHLENYTVTWPRGHNLFKLTGLHSLQFCVNGYVIQVRPHKPCWSPTKFACQSWFESWGSLVQYLLMKHFEFFGSALWVDFFYGISVFDGPKYPPTKTTFSFLSTESRVLCNNWIPNR